MGATMKRLTEKYFFVTRFDRRRLDGREWIWI